ncbi:Hypothetical_protein [Hexamita inflata]|uniref:Hypothetical_protein n=1 Tax=Hexamita inflata TaxID=28002 RepID=A0ABP1HWI8_9EUKA
MQCGENQYLEDGACKCKKGFNKTVNCLTEWCQIDINGQELTCSKSIPVPIIIIYAFSLAFVIICIALIISVKIKQRKAQISIKHPIKVIIRHSIENQTPINTNAVF